MSGERLIRTVKHNYWKLHNSGKESELESGSEIESEEGNKGKVLVEDTPCNTPGAGNTSPISTHTIPETQINSPVQGAVMSSIQEEITEAEPKQQKEAVEKEQKELEQRARVLTAQTEMEAKQRQLNLMRRQIEKLQEA